MALDATIIIIFYGLLCWYEHVESSQWAEMVCAQFREKTFKPITIEICHFFNMRRATCTNIWIFHGFKHHSLAMSRWPQGWQPKLSTTNPFTSLNNWDWRTQLPLFPPVAIWKSQTSPMYSKVWQWHLWEAYNWCSFRWIAPRAEPR